MIVKCWKAGSLCGPAFVLLLALAACHEGRPGDVVPPMKMAEFLTEAYQIEAYNSLKHPGLIDTLDPKIGAAYTDLLKRLDLTQESVEKSLDYYGHHPDQYEKILGEVLYRLDEMRNEF